MRGLLLKDLYTIGHNAKQMVLILALWALCFLPNTDGGGYIIMCGIMSGFMTATTFSFDEQCKWEKYAMILPVSKREYVLGKYVLLFIFSVMGCLSGTAVSLAVNLFRRKAMEEPFYVYFLLGIGISVVVGLIFLPLLIKFGAEKARIILLGAAGIPVALIFVTDYLITKAELITMEQLLGYLKWGFPLILVVMAAASIILSFRSFEKKEF